MNANLDENTFESLVARALLPVFKTAYGEKVKAYAKWWHNPIAGGKTKGGRNYASLRDFLIDCIRYPATRYGDGPFLSYEVMQSATVELWKDEEVARQAPHRSDAHVNATWFVKAGETFIEGERFIDRSKTLVDVVWYYRSKEGLYLIDNPNKRHVTRHH